MINGKLQELRELKTALKANKIKLAEKENRLHDLLVLLPNLPHVSVPNETNVIKMHVPDNTPEWVKSKLINK